MATSYPAKIDNNITLPDIVDNVTSINAVSINRLRDAIIAIETELGINPGGIYPNVKTRLDYLTTLIGSGGGDGGIQLGGDLGGTELDPVVIGLQGRPISSSSPNTSQVLKWNGISWAPSFIAGGSANLVQYNTGSGFGGATHVSISSDQYLQLTDDRAGGAAQTGDLRFAKQATIWARSYTGSQDITIISHSEVNAPLTSPIRDILDIGRDGNTNSGYFDSLQLWGKYSGSLGTRSAPSSVDATISVYGKNYSVAKPNTSYIAASPNLAILPLSFNTYTNDPFDGGGLGYFMISDLQTATSNNPVSGFWMWSDPTTHHPYIKLPSGLSYDLISSNGPGGDGYSVQYKLDSGFGGAAHVSISAPEGYLKISDDRSGGAAQRGDVRFAKDSAVFVKSQTGLTDICVWSHSDFSSIDSTARNVVSFGYDRNASGYASDIIDIVANHTAGFLGGTGAWTTSLGVFGNIATLVPTRFVYANPNLDISIQSPTVAGVVAGGDPFGGGTGIVRFGDRGIAAAGNPTNSFWMWSDPITHRPTVQLPNGSTYDLVAANYPVGDGYAIQYKNNTAFAGASHASISQTDGYLQISNDRYGGSATTGDLRFSKNFTITSRDKFNTKNLYPLWQYSSSGLPDGYQDNVLQIADGFDIVTSYANSGIALHTVDKNAISLSSGLFIYRDNILANGTLSKGIYAYPNFTLGTDSDLITHLATDPFTGGKGIFFLKDRITLPSGNPSSGFFLWSDSATHHPTVQLPNGSIYDLISDGYLNGATVPAAGSLVTGHVLQVSGISATTYGYVTNANVDAAAAIAGTKISPNFGSQDIITAGNVGLFQTPSYGSGTGVIFIGNATSNPSTNPTAGVVLYSDVSDGYLKYRQTTGNIVTINNGTSFNAGGDLTGTPTLQVVSKLQGITLDTSNFIDGYALTYNSASSTIKFGAAAGSGSGLTKGQHDSLRSAIHFLPDGPGLGFPSGSYKEILPAADPFPTSIIWWTSSGKTAKIFEKTITYNVDNLPTTIEYKMYDTNGSTILETIEDVITYSPGTIFEASRTRTIS